MSISPNDILTNAHELYNRPQVIGMPLLNRIFLGKVRDTRDPQKMGRIKVWIPDVSGNRDNAATWFTASYCSPFAGASFVNDGYYKDTQTNDAIQQKSSVAANRTPPNVAGSLGGRQGYGMWFPAPDVGNDVLVAFIAGDPVNCVYFGFLFPQDQNFMVPGAPTATYSENDGLPIDSGPALETDLRNRSNLGSDSPQRKPFTALAQGLIAQGLQDDTIRGQSTSGARRESPSQAMGILTPSGHQIVYDDGDDQGNSSLIRLRTRSGAQLLIDEVTGNIYAISKNGRTWIELNDDGNFDVYGQSNVSVHAENGNINLVTSSDDINIQSAKDVNIRAAGSLNFYAGEQTNIVTKLDFRSTVGGQIQFGSSGHATFASAQGLSLSSGGKASLTGAGVAIGSSGSIGISASGSVDIVGSSVNNNVGPGLAPDPGSIEAPGLPDIYSGLPEAPVIENGVKKKGPNSLTAIVSRKPQAEPWDRNVAGSYTPNFQGSETANDLVDGPAAPIPASLKSRGQNIYTELKKRGFNDFVCAACLGVWQQESSLSPSAQEPKRDTTGWGIGLAQWSRDRLGGGRWGPGRRQKMIDFATSKGRGWNDLYTQLDFFVHELGTSESKAGNTLRSATALSHAMAGMKQYERYGEVGRREQYAREWLTRIKEGQIK
ncbi:MAG: phage tail tip lysozyme [Gammaproteobacteria bacterium]|nr:phage tail tip lysozyme [Gammaproteobacteria bacterium]